MKVPSTMLATLLKVCLLASLAALACAAQSEAQLGTKTLDDGAAAPQLPSAPSVAQGEQVAYAPMTNHQRLHWFVGQIAGPKHIAAGVFTAAFGTGRDAPHEYRGTWAGFGKRFASREAGVVLSNAMEAGLGSLWGEDPRYFRNANLSFGHRVGSIVKQTFVARRRDGSYHLAYARYSAFAGSNFITNAWRPDSEADAQHALSRTGWAFLGRMAGNAWDEFWPDAKRHILHRHH